MKKCKDFLLNELNVGDFIVFMDRIDKEPLMHLGRIKSIIEREFTWCGKKERFFSVNLITVRKGWDLKLREPVNRVTEKHVSDTANIVKLPTEYVRSLLIPEEISLLLEH